MIRRMYTPENWANFRRGYRAALASNPASPLPIHLVFRMECLNGFRRVVRRMDVGPSDVSIATRILLACESAPPSFWFNVVSDLEFRRNVIPGFMGPRNPYPPCP